MREKSRTLLGILVPGLLLCATAAAVFFRGLIRRKQKGVSDHA